MNIVTLPQYRAEQLRGTLSTHIISIRTPGDAVPLLAEGFGAYTYVEMSDTNDPEPHAVRKVVDAARYAIAANTATLVIHCHIGVSRRVGAARAIAEHADAHYDAQWPGNEAVRCAMLGALRRTAAGMV